MITLIDKTIVIQFIKNFFFALLCFILIFILVDLFENLDKFIDNKVSFTIVLDYYYYFIPEIIRLITPVAVLLATLFTAGSLVNYNEIVAIKNAGISLVRFMIPFLAVGFIITAVSVYFNNWIVAEANKKKFFIERTYLGKNRITIGLNKLYFQEGKNQLVLIENFNEKEFTANNVSVLLFNKDTLTKLNKRIDAKSMKWENNSLVLYDASERIFNDTVQILTNFQTVGFNQLTDFTKINITPEQIIKKQLKPDEMNYTELKEFIETMSRGGHDINRQLVDYYSKISFSFSNIVVVIFGISISAGSKKRRGLALQFGISILVSFIYLGFVKIFQSFGYNGDLNPMLTAWIANIAFASIGIANLYFKNY